MGRHSGTVLLADALKEFGLRKRAGDIFTWGDDEWMGWLGINKASRTSGVGQVMLHPVVGVRSRSVEEIVARGRRKKAHTYIPPTYRTPLYWLMPERRSPEWVVTGGPDDRRIVAEVVDAVGNYGLPFVALLSDMKALERALAEEVSKGDTRSASRWLATAWLTGHENLFSHAVQVIRSRWGPPSYPAAVEIKTFCDWIEEYATSSI